MALLVLGTKDVNFGDGWVGFDPVNLTAGRTYLLELEVLSSDPDKIYSSFVVRYLYPTQNSPQSSSLDIKQFYFEEVRQNWEFTISPLAAATGNLRFFVRRFPFWGQPSSLAPTQVRLAIDPVIFV